MLVMIIFNSERYNMSIMLTKNRKALVLITYIILIIIMIISQDILSEYFGQKMGAIAIAVIYPLFFYVSSIIYRKREVLIHVISTAAFVVSYFVFWYKTDYIMLKYLIAGVVSGIFLTMIISPIINSRESKE